MALATYGFCEVGGRLHLLKTERAGGRVLVRVVEACAAALSVALLQSLKKKHGIGKAPCRLLLSANEHRLLQVDAPETENREDLLAALRWKVKELVDFPVEKATLDAFDLKLEGAAAVRGRQCIVAIVRDDWLAPRIQAFQAAKLELTVIDIPELAQRNVCNAFAKEGRGQVFLNFGDAGGLLTFVFRGDLYVERKIEIRLEALETADEAKRTELYDRIALEVQRSIDNFERMYSFIPLAELAMLDLPSLPGLLDYLKGYLSVNVNAVDLAGAFDFSAVDELRSPRRQAEWLPLLGLALRDDTAVLATPA